MTSSHANCDHDTTKAARATCRKNRAQVDTAHEALISSLLDAMPANELGYDWVIRGAQGFSNYQGSDRREAAEALLTYFAPTDDEASNARRRANGYLLTTDAYAIRRAILHRNS